MRLLASSVLMYAYPLSEIIPLANHLGYDGIEVWHFHLLQTGEKAVDVARVARQHNMYLSVHALSWDLNYTSRLESVREASLQALESSIRLTSELGAETIVVHPGRITIPQEDPEKSWQDLIEGTLRLVMYAQKKQIKFSIEIMEHIPREFFINPQDAARLVEEIDSPALTVTMDTAHVPWGQDLVTYLQAIPRLDHIHISDCTSKKMHLPLGEGERDHTQFLAYVLEHFPDISMAIEGIEFSLTPELMISNKKQFDTLLSSVTKKGAANNKY